VTLPPTEGRLVAEETNTERAPQSTRALDRGLQLLSCLAENPQGLSAPDLATRNNLSRATVYRLLTTLEARRFVVLDEANRHYFLGRAIDPFASHETTLALAAIATPELEALCGDVHESVGLHIRVGMQRVLIHKVEPPNQFLRYVIPVGTPRPLATGATGAVLTFGLEDSEIAQAVELANDATLLRKVKVKVSSLARQHDHLHKQGYCSTEETTVPDLASIAGPVFVGERVLAAIAVSGPASRFQAAERKRAGERLAAAAERLSATMLPSG